MDSAAEKPVIAATAAPIAGIPDFQIDFQVQEEGSLFQKGQKWVWKRFVIRGQQLTVSDMKSNPMLHIHTTKCSLQAQSGHQYLLQENGTTKCTLLCPSSTVLGKFRSVLCLSATTPQWTLPRQDIFQALVDVATTIVETHETTPRLTKNAPPSVKPAQVAKYLAHIKPTYDHVITLPTSNDLLAYLTQLEADYLVDRAHIHNFAHTVHQHHAVDYVRSRTDPSWVPPNDVYSNCPYVACRATLATDVAFRIRVAGAAVPCARCGGILSAETFRVVAFRRDTPSLPHQSTTTKGRVNMPLVPLNVTFVTYMQLVAEALRYHAADASTKKAVTDTVVAYFQRVDLVAAMARHLIFVSLLCGNYAYWSHPTVLVASIIRYNHFCQLVDNSPNVWMPTIDIALVRYVHQTIPRATSLLPFFNLPTANDGARAYAETFLLWAETFQGPYSSFAPSYEAYQANQSMMKLPFRKLKWARFHAVPSRDCRFVGVDEATAPPAAVAVAVPTQPDTSAPPPTASEFVAVIGTPLLDNRVRPPREAAAVLRGPHDSAAFDAVDPFSMVMAVDIGLNLLVMPLCVVSLFF
ncbi:Aste57867_9498 [Aphanomyces stellatus]|uniref:Aste57867_9498 protein n=1 Tax=Aphanomyces stellatus TaxID=120398 RepID=A0A485KN47_9STRA|nr:hypothetical protein As57867_009461 [Aphanomyces stellatus]VFT86377.1 Aste57867_9498 [Aphanomyces stellatus]